jgi:poly(3-hydroxybutyrate) depolymerase
MTTADQNLPRNRHEHSVPLFWPVAAAIELGQAGIEQFQKNLRFLSVVEQPAKPSEWATANHVVLELDTLRLRDFTPAGTVAVGLPVLVDAPYAGHASTIADYAPGQSLVHTLQSNGLARVLVTDWKCATLAMKDFGIDQYLADLNTVVEHLGGQVHLVGLCQGGWLSAMLAARYPEKVVSLVLAGAPIDTHAGQGPLKKIVKELPLHFYQDLVKAGGGLMRGQTMLTGWKNMNAGEQFFGKYLDLYQHIEDKNYVARTRHFESWYENPIDLPGAYYLQAIEWLFKENRFANGKFVGLGQRLLLKDVVCPTYLLAGSDDDITPKEQVFAAEKLLGTPADQIISKTAPGGHIGLFMGTRTLSEFWPGIARWIATIDTTMAAATTA